MVRLRSADGWISYLHAITGDPMLISAAEAGDDAEVRADIVSYLFLLEHAERFAVLVRLFAFALRLVPRRHRVTCHNKHTQA